MKISIASGKGGTGKTTVAVNLALALDAQGMAVTYADCDVEEPNGHLFLKPRIDSTESIGVPIPQVDDQLCTFCGLCSEICQYGAIASLPEKTLVYSGLCHGCGGCQLVCPAGAITEGQREIGVVETGSRGRVGYIGGRLRVGEAQSPPLIRAVKRALPTEGVSIIDSPPGTSCPVIESVKGSDFVILVTEPTPFGLHDLKLAVEMLRFLGLPFGVVINRADIGDDRVICYCALENLDILLQIPDQRGIAEAYSRAVPAIVAFPELADDFVHMFAWILCKKQRAGARVAR
jgi:MinD superfamily P-loop ATPase